MSDAAAYHFDFTAPASNSGLASCRTAMEASALYEKLPDRLRFAADLSLDELATNTIKYGSSDGTTFDFRLQYVDKMLHIEYQDRGSPFDPWEHATQKLAALEDTDDPEIGGRGLIMMKELSTRRNYERRDASNVITLSVPENDQS